LKTLGRNEDDEDLEFNLANVTDGLRAERVQGITIDVAYRFFSTAKRKFIVADTPGHVQYTRNMVTGASTAEVALILVDARKGIQEQTRRHSYISTLLGIRKIVLCVNKMDLVDYSQDNFDEIVAEYGEFIKRKHLPDVNVWAIPVCALKGDNVVSKSSSMDWYQGPPLLELLENLPLEGRREGDARFVVQCVVRPQGGDYRDFRGFAGLVTSGVMKVGDPVTVLPSGVSSKIKSILLYPDYLGQAICGQSVTIELEQDVDVSRGDTISGKGNLPEVSNELKAMLCWFGETPLKVGKKYALQHTGHSCRAIIKELCYAVDVTSLDSIQAESLNVNEIGLAMVKTSKEIICEPYVKNRNLGSFILIDEVSNETVGAGMIQGL